MARRGVGSATKRTKDSFDRAAKKIEKANLALVGRSISGLRLIGEEIMLDVKASRFGAGVPVDKGTLRSSGRVEGPTTGVVSLSFGGAAAPYALEQHENVSLHHDIGEARYLVRGIDRWKQNGISVARALAELNQAIEAVAVRRGR